MDKFLFDFLPKKQFFSLKEAVELKGIALKTLYNRKILRPSPAKHIGGRLVFSRESIVIWLHQTDEDMISSNTNQSVNGGNI